MNHIRYNIYIGDKEEAKKRNRLELNDIVYTVSLCDETNQYTTIHAPINDGKNEMEKFDAAVDAVLEAMSREYNVLIYCASGISRSVVLVSVALAIKENLTFDEALSIVEDNHPKSNPHPELARLAKEYLS